jgi:transcriptional regulator with XRE-family HTH domain
MKEIIGEINEAIKESGLSIAELARETGLTRQTITYIMKEKRAGVNLHTACRLCDALNLKITITKNQNPKK